ncbi:MAG: hypothetical protein MHPSP_002074, partial [Paramarteilia canceri]
PKKSTVLKNSKQPNNNEKTTSPNQNLDNLENSSNNISQINDDKELVSVENFPTSIENGNNIAENSLILNLSPIPESKNKQKKRTKLRRELSKESTTYEKEVKEGN